MKVPFEYSGKGGEGVCLWLQSELAPSKANHYKVEPKLQTPGSYTCIVIHCWVGQASPTLGFYWSEQEKAFLAASFGLVDFW